MFGFYINFVGRIIERDAKGACLLLSPHNLI